MANFVHKAVKFCLFSLLFCFFAATTYAGPGVPFKHIVFFGDSLSDNGNLFSLFFQYLPKSPPYYSGRFSNGEVWSEKMGKAFNEVHGITYDNYAYGGQTTIFHNPAGGYLPYTLSFSVDSYLLHSIWQDRSTTLFVIWIGANDYLHGAADQKKMTTDVTNKIRDTVASLISHGAKNFLILNMPDLSITPYAKLNNMQTELAELTIRHNAKLEYVTEQLAKAYPEQNIHLYDINALFTGVIQHIDEYDQRYHVDINDVTDSCWNGGYRLHGLTAKDKAQLEQEVATDLMAHIKQTTAKNESPSLDVRAMAKHIVDTPVLMEAYNMQKQVAAADGDTTQVLCTNPEQFFFWDHVHPTQAVHTLFSQIMYEYIDKTYEHV